MTRILLVQDPEAGGHILRSNALDSIGPLCRSLDPKTSFLASSLLLEMARNRYSDRPHPTAEDSAVIQPRRWWPLAIPLNLPQQSRNQHIRRYLIAQVDPCESENRLLVWLLRPLQC